MTSMDTTISHPTNSRRTICTLQLEAASELAPHGLKVSITAAPHRSGDPHKRYYEAWFLHSGGTLRSSLCFHLESARDLVLSYVADVTGIDYDKELNNLLDQYNWENDKD